MTNVKYEILRSLWLRSRISKLVGCCLKTKRKKYKLNPRIWKKRNCILHLRKLKKRTKNAKQRKFEISEIKTNNLEENKQKLEGKEVKEKSVKF